MKKIINWFKNYLEKVTDVRILLDEKEMFDSLIKRGCFSEKQIGLLNRYVQLIDKKLGGEK